MEYIPFASDISFKTVGVRTLSTTQINTFGRILIFFGELNISKIRQIGTISALKSKFIATSASDESDFGGAATAVTAAAGITPTSELSANLRANYPSPPKIVCTDSTSVSKERTKGE